MPEPIFDHERLDVYRLSIDYVAFSYQIARSLKGVNRHARDQWLRAAQSIPLNIAEGNGKQRIKVKNRFFEFARGSTRKCALIHDALRVCDAIAEDANQRGKSKLRRIVSMLTRLIQRTKRGIGGANRVRVRAHCGILTNKAMQRSGNGVPIFR